MMSYTVLDRPSLIFGRQKFNILNIFRYTEKGYRVIALARKNLAETMNYRKIQRMERTDSEKDLTFLGLIILENRWVFTLFIVEKINTTVGIRIANIQINNLSE